MADDDIAAAIREIRAFLEVNEPETLAFMARVGDRTEIITAGEEEQGKFEQIDIIVYYLEKLADSEGIELDESGGIEVTDFGEERDDDE